MPPKTTCAVTRQQFRAGAKPISVTIAGVPHSAVVKEFSTGSLGWYLNGKTTVEIDGVHVPVQIGLNLTVVGSKDLPKDAVTDVAEGSSGDDRGPSEAEEPTS